MTNVTVKLLAKEMQVSTDYVISQLAKIKIYKTVSDIINLEEKEILFSFLKRNNNLSSKRYNFDEITLHRKAKMKSTLNILGSDGKSKLVNVEIRKKLTYVNSYQVKQLDHKLNENIEIESNEKNSFDIQINKKLKENLKSNDINKIENITKRDSILAEKNINRISDNSSNKSKKNKIFINKADGLDDNIEYHLVKENKLIDVENLNILKLKDVSSETKKEKFRKIKKNVSQVFKDKDDIFLNKNNLTSFNNRFHNNIKEKINIKIKYKNSHTKSYKSEYGHKYKIENEKNYRNRINKIIKNKKENIKLTKHSINNEKSNYVLNKINKNSFLTQRFNKPVKTIKRNVIIGETISISELANKMAIQVSQVVKAIINLVGTTVTINNVIDQETAQLIVEEMGHRAILYRENKLEESILKHHNNKNSNNLKLRAPIVTIMGHVDHGKTSLLDYILSTKITVREYGGITQHIGAYHIKNKNCGITFLDTPGHAAFTTMRANGAKITDIILLVVAADDGVMPQTIEAIEYAKTYNVPVIVAINKIDKPEAKLDLVEKELIKYGIVPEKWGGENQFVYISAKLGNGIEELLNAILLQAEILELKAIYDCMAKGVVIESSLSKGLGPLAKIIILEGTLKKGNVVLCGSEYGRVRAMKNELGNDILSAVPSIPVEILGLSGVPSTGNEIVVVPDEKKAREVALYRQNKSREIKLSQKNKHNIENIFVNMVKENQLSEINIALKSDVYGTAEAIKNALNNLTTQEVKLKVINSGIGEITESDVSLANTSSNFIIIGFNVKVSSTAKRIIEKENINLRCYSVIYELIKDIKEIMNKMSTPKYKREITGVAEVRDTFCSSKFGNIAGCIITNGIVKNHSSVRILRKNLVVHEGEIESIRRFKDSVNEVRNGTECGIGIKNYSNFIPGDIIEVFENIKV